MTTAGAASPGAAALAALRDWVTGVCGLPATDAPTPGDDDAPARVLLLPVAMAPTTPTGPPSRVVDTADVALTVLVAVVGGTATSGAVVAADLALAAQEEGTWTVDPDGPTLALWRALGLRPRAGLLVEVPVRRSLSRRAAAPVRRPLQVQGLPLRLVWGRVVAGDGTGLAGAAVTVLPHGPRATTDRLGRFGVRVAVPPDAELRLRVHARGADVVVHRGPADDGGLGDLTVPGLPP